MKRCAILASAIIVVVSLSIGTVLGDVPVPCVGIWSGGKSGLANESYLVIRNDSTGGMFGISKRGEEFRAYEFDFETVGDRLNLKHRWAMRKGKRRDYEVEDGCAIWLDAGSGKLILSDGKRTEAFERATGMEDPFRRSETKTRKELVTGVWSGGSEFKAYTIVLAEDGEAMLIFAAGGAMGKWSLTDDGNVNFAAEADGVRTNLLVRYNVAEDTMRLGDNIAIGRNVKVSPAEAMLPVKEKIAEQQRELQRRRDEKWADKFSSVTTNSFETVDGIFKCLLADMDEHFFARSISIETGVDGLVDVFYISRENTLFGMAHLGCGYSETGPRPNEAAENARRMCVYKRPSAMPDAQRTFDLGIDEIRTGAKTLDRISCEDEYLGWSYEGWQSWAQGVRISWPLEKGQEKNAVNLLQPRFKGRFPCKGKVMTVRKKK